MGYLCLQIKKKKDMRYMLFTFRSSLENEGVSSRMQVRICRRCDNPKVFIFSNLHKNDECVFNLFQPVSKFNFLVNVKCYQL